MLESPESFEQAFKVRCSLREIHTQETFSFKILPESPANELYWKIAQLLFTPQTMQEMLSILLPSVNTHLQVTIPDELPRAMSKRNLDNTIRVGSHNYKQRIPCINFQFSPP